MAKSIGSPAREIETFSSGLWQAEYSFPGINRATGVDARKLTHIFGEGSKGNSIRDIDTEPFGSGDIMGVLENPSDDRSLLIEIACKTHDKTLSSIADGMSPSSHLPQIGK